MRVLVACALTAIFGLLAVEDDAMAESRMLCGQTVESNVVSPGSDASADVGAFSGVWQGRLRRDGRCFALIVENVGRDSVAALIVVFGDLPGYAQNLGASGTGARRFRSTGTVKQSVMEIRLSTGSTITLKASAPNQLVASCQWVPSGSDLGVLKREP
jgi:hypothetical protein